jgi:hypothetical protein
LIYPAGVPVALVAAIEAFEAGAKQHEAHVYDEIREKREST